MTPAELTRWQDEHGGPADADGLDAGGASARRDDRAIIGSDGEPRDARRGTPFSEGSNRHLRRLLDAIGACAPGRDWVGERDLRSAWMECPCGDWMLLAAECVGVDRRFTVLAAARCIDTLMASKAPPDDPRSRQALDAALRWTHRPTDENLQRAYAAAEAAGEASDAAEGVDPLVASAAARLIRDPEAAVADAADACSYLGGGDRPDRRARVAALRRYADIVRATIPFDAVSRAAAEAVAELERTNAGSREYRADTLEKLRADALEKAKTKLLGEIGVQEARRRALAQPAR